jgi:D-3-phosphoglycerate dehydrogenase
MKETHHLIGEPEIAQLKPDTCILNFARGELVDADALAHKFDAGSTGKYICDFALPPVLLGRANVLSIPHLGASTEEAEENAASMAADTIREFLETGSIRHSVNFPTCALPLRADSMARITVVNDNRPGMLGTIMSLFGDARINILQQMNTSRGEIAYNVIDVDKPAEGGDKDHFTCAGPP